VGLRSCRKRPYALFGRRLDVSGQKPISLPAMISQPSPGMGNAFDGGLMRVLVMDFELRITRQGTRAALGFRVSTRAAVVESEARQT